MNNLREILSTEKGREDMASRMVVPLRCGGMDYIKDNPFYRFAGYLLSVEELESLQGLNTEHFETRFQQVIAEK